jgi:type IV pilus assembly protein PilY1
LKSPIKQITIQLLITLLLSFLPISAHTACLSGISDLPLETSLNPAPANIMFILDNSGSMDWEFMTSEKDGLYQNKYYLYPDSAYINGNDRVYADGNELDDIQKREWQSQWHGYNKLFYNSNLKYEPWPQMSQAGISQPWSNPNNNRTGDSKFNMAGEYFSLPAQCSIVDNKDSGFSINTARAWELSSPDGVSFYGDDYYTTTELNDAVDDWVKWTPSLPSAGNYKVAVWWQTNAGRASNVYYEVHHNGETASVGPFNMQVNGGKWNDIGEFYFSGDRDGGESEYVLLNPAISGRSTYSADAVMFYKTDNMISIKNAHYFMLNDLNKNSQKDAGEDVYLINFIDTDGNAAPDSREYYRFHDKNSNGYINTGELIYESLVPDGVKAGIDDEQGNFIRFATAAEDIQNFANWFSFHRKREFAAKAAVATTINDMEGVFAGFYSINSESGSGLRQPVSALKVQSENGMMDSASTLLSLLYGMDSAGSTPLRVALKSVGQYYHTHDGHDGGLGQSPYAASEQGGSCQQSFAIIITDGFWNGPAPGVGNQDADSSSPYDGPPYADSYSETLADVAMKYYKEDLAPSLDNMVPMNSCDNANHQHMVTHCISFGISGTLNPGDYHSCLMGGKAPQWANPIASEAQKTDDLWHTALNGRGLFFSASDPQELLSSLQAIASPISSKPASGASVAIKGNQVSTGSVLYQASYISDEWTGDVTAYPMNLLTGEINQTDIIWRASEKLKLTDWETRKIVTYDPLLSQGIPFSYNFLNDAQKAVLNSDINLPDYIKGKAVQGFRTRTAKLGDIVHSTPILIGDTIFIGANDGMLHALNAGTGDERFAYIPNMVLKNFHDSVYPEKSFYKNDYEHRYFVDSSPFVRANTDIDNDGSDTCYTFLVGGLGKGGKGYYCLDITFADTKSKDSSIDEIRQMVKWEYPGNQSYGQNQGQNQDNDMGYSYSTALIVKSNAPAREDPNKQRWIVIFGNGYESVNGNSVLYILNMDGTLLKKIYTDIGQCNGLSTPAVVDIDSNMTADYVYAGDLNGNLWKFDIRDRDPTNWDIAFKDGMGNPAPLFSIPGKPITSKPEVMFHCGPDTGPAVGPGCAGQTHTGYMIFFGTGKYISAQDRSSADQQYLFGIWDYGHDDDESAYLGQFREGESPQLSNMHPDIQLKEQTVVFSDYWSGTFMRVLSDNNPNWSMSCTGQSNFPTLDPSAPANAGWYFKLPMTGERIINDLILRDGILLFTSFIPNTSPCSGGGNSIVHIIDACTGGRLKMPFWDINKDGKIDTKDLVDCGLRDEDGIPIPLAPSGMEMPGLLHKPVLVRMPDNPVEIQIFSSSAGNIETVLKTAEPTGMFYWRQW